MRPLRKVRCPHCRALFRPKNAGGTLPPHDTDVNGDGRPYRCPMYGTYLKPISSKRGVR